MTSDRLVVVGASAGGVNAIMRLLQELPKGFQWPIAFVQHLPARSIIDVNTIFGRYTNNAIFEIEDKMPIENGRVYFAPPGYHVLVETTRSFALCLDEPVNFSRPSIDVFFESAALAYGKNLIGILMSGANNDGAKGMERIHLNGGLTIVQDPEEAEVNTMPYSALKRIKPDRVSSIPGIAHYLDALNQGGSLG